MRSLFHFRWLLAFVLGLGSLLPAYATHIRGGDISYTSIASTTAGVPRYHIVVRLFLNSLTPVKQETIVLLATKGSCGINPPTINAPNISKLSSTPSLIQFCLSATQQAYDIALYATDFDLPTGQWTLSFIGENRASDIVNIASSITTTLYISAFIDNTLVQQDASPKFESVLVPTFNNNAVPAYSFSAFDTDADSLHYDFMLPRMVAGGLANASACSQELPSTQLSPHFALSTSTGALMPATPGGLQGYYVVAARVSEYRRIAGQWQLIGYVMRDLTYLTQTSANQVPAFTSLSLNGGAAQAPSQPIMAQPGQTLRLTLTATDPDAGQQLRFTSEAPSVVPGLSLTTLNGQAQLTWQVPATLPPGRYAVPVAVLDDGCPYNASQEQTLVFVVTNQALATQPSLDAESAAYPVPFREQVQFRAAPGQAVTLVDALGRVVASLRAGADGRVLWQPAASLPAGLYLARTAEGRALARLLRE